MRRIYWCAAWKTKAFWQDIEKVDESLEGLMLAIDANKDQAAEGGEKREKWLLSLEVEDILRRYKALS